MTIISIVRKMPKTNDLTLALINLLQGASMELLYMKLGQEGC